MKKLAVPAFLLLLFSACKKEENLAGRWNVEESTFNFPFRNSLSFNPDSVFEGHSDSLDVQGKWWFSSHHNGDYVTVTDTAAGDTLIFKIERLVGKKMQLSVYGFSFTHDYATLKK